MDCNFADCPTCHPTVWTGAKPIGDGDLPARLTHDGPCEHGVPCPAPHPPDHEHTWTPYNKVTGQQDEPDRWVCRPCGTVTADLPAPRPPEPQPTEADSTALSVTIRRAQRLEEKLIAARDGLKYIRMGHNEARSKPGYCVTCNVRWPCDTYRRAERALDQSSLSSDLTK
jgi:hypothetical protein